MTRMMSAAAAVALLGLSTAAYAAGGGAVSVSKVSGGVLVNQGQGFRPATPGMTLNPGDRVLVTLNGRAGLNYSGGCGVSLGAGSMATISNATPCQSGARSAGIISPSSRGATPNGFGSTTPITIIQRLGGGGSSSP